MGHMLATGTARAQEADGTDVRYAVGEDGNIYRCRMQTFSKMPGNFYAELPEGAPDAYPQGWWSMSDTYRSADGAMEAAKRARRGLIWKKGKRADGLRAEVAKLEAQIRELSTSPIQVFDMAGQDTAV